MVNNSPARLLVARAELVALGEAPPPAARDSLKSGGVEIKLQSAGGPVARAAVTARPARRGGGGDDDEDDDDDDDEL